MKIRLIRNVGIRGIGYDAGTELEVDKTDGHNLVVMGKAIDIDPVPVDDAAPAEEPKAIKPPKANSRKK